MHGVYIAHTHREWFDTLSRYAAPLESGALHLDEVNFWSPSASRSMKNFAPGEPVFFRLGAPTRAVAGYGYFAEVHQVDVHLAWDLFGYKNGATDKVDLARLLGRSRVEQLAEPLTCTVLRDAVFWPDWRWIAWGEERGYPRTGAQRGRTDRNPGNIRLLLERMAADRIPAPLDLAPEFIPLDIDDRVPVEVTRRLREGQGTFRLRLLKAYGGRCAVTGEHTEPVLQAAHIQRYLGPASNHVANGLVLTQEFHTLFDRGLVCVEPRGDAYQLRVSNLLQELWNNGRRYRDYDRHVLHVPPDPALRPSKEALEWHRDTLYERVA